MNLMDAFYIPIAALTAPVWAGKKRSGWAERFGKTAALPPVRSGAVGRLLIHAVSVGEVSALRPLVPLLSDFDVVISSTTDTGLARATQLFSPSCHVVRYPLDFSWAVERFLNAVKPDAVALVELEVWPNFVSAARRRNIPVCIINGRLSERSFRGYRRIRPFVQRWLGALDFVAAQDQVYAARFEDLGVAASNCLLTGSMKWDSADIGTDGLAEGAERLAAELGIDRNRPLIVAGSTGPGEEALLHEACPPGVQLLCAPRKPDRFEEAAAALPGCVRRTQPLTVGGMGGGSRQRFLLDTIGELRKAYSLASVVVVGRSFGDQYGSDPIEPIGLGKATVIGPAVSDFGAIVGAFVAAGGILQTTRGELAAVLGSLLADEGRCRQLAERGRQCIRDHQGASARHADLLGSMVRTARGVRTAGQGSLPLGV